METGGIGRGRFRFGGVGSMCSRPNEVTMEGATAENPDEVEGMHSSWFGGGGGNSMVGGGTDVATRIFLSSTLSLC